MAKGPRPPRRRNNKLDISCNDQRALAKAVGVSYSTLRRYIRIPRGENHRQCITPPLASAMAMATWMFHRYQNNPADIIDALGAGTEEVVAFSDALYAYARNLAPIYEDETEA
jgi:hypothetical protein